MNSRLVLSFWPDACVIIPLCSVSHIHTSQQLTTSPHIPILHAAVALSQPQGLFSTSVWNGWGTALVPPLSVRIPPRSSSSVSKFNHVDHYHNGVSPHLGFSNMVRSYLAMPTIGNNSIHSIHHYTFDNASLSLGLQTIRVRFACTPTF
jgi:hypothetical protein